MEWSTKDTVLKEILDCKVFFFHIGRWRYMAFRAVSRISWLMEAQQVPVLLFGREKLARSEVLTMASVVVQCTHCKPPNLDSISCTLFRF